MPISTAAPRARVDRNAAVATSGRPVASTAQSTPLPTSARTASAVDSESPCHCTACVAPQSMASASFCSETSTAITHSAPAARAPITAESPTPPQPITATRSPGRTSPVFQTAPMPVVTAQPTIEATSSGASSSMTTHDASGTTHASANVDRNE